MSNTSVAYAGTASLHIAPHVYLDYYAVPAAGNVHLIYAFDSMFQSYVKAWFVGTQHV